MIITKRLKMFFIIVTLFIIILLSPCSFNDYDYNYYYVTDRIHDCRWLDNESFVCIEEYDAEFENHGYIYLINIKTNFKKILYNNYPWNEIQKMRIEDNNLLINLSSKILQYNITTNIISSYSTIGNSAILSDDYNSMYYTKGDTLFFHNCKTLKDSMIMENVSNVIFADWERNYLIGYYDSTIIQIILDSSNAYIIADLNNDMYNDISVNIDFLDFAEDIYNSNIINLRFSSRYVDNTALSIDISNNKFSVLDTFSQKYFVKNEKGDYIVTEYSNISIYNKDDQLIKKYNKNDGVLYEE